MKTGKNKVLNIITSVVPAAMVLGVYYLFDRDDNVLFLCNIFLTVLIIIKARFSLFSLKALLITYVLLAIFWQYNYGNSYGILELGNYEIDYHMINLLPLIYLSIVFIFLNNTNILDKERVILTTFCSRKMSNTSVCVLSLIAIVSSIIAFPAIITGGNRFESLLPGNAWNHIAIIALLLLYPRLKDSMMAKVAYCFCVIWFILQGERVDMIGLLFGVIVLSVHQKSTVYSKKKLLKNVKYVLLCVIVIMVAVFIGEKRAGAGEMSAADITKKIIVQNTASDVGYIYNLSLKYRRYNKSLNGATYIQYIDELMPFGEDSHSASKILDDKYGTPGGIYLLSEPYMNFGVTGIIAFGVIELTVIYFVLRSRKYYFAAIYVYILITAFRTSWYGISYIETGIIYIMPLLTSISFIIDSTKSKKAISGE